MELPELGSGSLTAVRNWIGSLQSAVTSGLTQSFNLVSVDHRKKFIITELQESVLKHTFLEASYTFTFTNNSNKLTKHISNRIVESSDAMVFIQGTGLESFLEYYKLDYNADILREKFYEIFKIK